MGILTCFAVAALSMGKRVQSPNYLPALNIPQDGTCQYSAQLNYLYAFAYKENDRTKSLMHLEKAAAIGERCKLDPILSERIRQFKISTL